MFNILLEERPPDRVDYSRMSVRLGDEEDGEHVEGYLIGPRDLYAHLRHHNLHVFTYQSANVAGVVGCNTRGGNPPPEPGDVTVPAAPLLPDISEHQHSAGVSKVHHEETGAGTRQQDAFVPDRIDSDLQSSLQYRIMTPEEREAQGRDPLEDGIEFVWSQETSNLSGHKREKLANNLSYVKGSIEDRLLSTPFASEVAVHVGRTLRRGHELDIVLHDSPKRFLNGLDGHLKNRSANPPHYEPDPETGFVLRFSDRSHQVCGQVVENETGRTLYVLPVSPFGLGSYFREVINEYVDVLSVVGSEQNPQDLQDYYTSEEQVSEVLSEISTNNEANGLFAKYERNKNELEREEQNLARARQELGSLQSTLEDLERRAENGEAEYYEGHLEEELSKLSRNSKVESFMFNPRGDKRLWVYTKELMVRDPRSGRVHQLGRYEITIDVTSLQSDGLRVFNLDRQVDGYDPDMQAPHIFPRGSLCAGNFGGMYEDVIVEEQWATLVSEVIRFLESVNTDDVAGKAVENWPFASDYAKSRYEEEHGNLP